MNHNDNKNNQKFKELDDKIQTNFDTLSDRNNEINDLENSKLGTIG